MPTKISGMEVPKAISVKPMMNSLTPSLPAKIEEKSINLSAENITTAKLIMKKIIVTSRLIPTSSALMVMYFTVIEDTNVLEWKKIQYN